MSVTALVLAGGGSTRMGQPKARLRWRGRSFLEHVVRAAQAAGCEPVIIIDGAVSLADDAAALGVALFTNTQWKRGQLSSLQTGLLGVPDGAAALVLTVDRPHVKSSTLEALVAAHETDPSAIWRPRHDGKRGHPILYAPDFLPELAALPATATPRDLLDRPDVAPRRRTLDVDDPATLDNLDAPDDLSHLPP